MRRKIYTLLALLTLSISAMAQGYYDDYEIQRTIDEADRVIYEAERSMYYDRYGRPHPQPVVRYTDEYGRRHKVNRDAYGNYYDYSTYSCYENATNTHRNPRYSGYYPSNGYYNGVVYVGGYSNRNHNYNSNYNSNYNYNDNYNGGYNRGYYRGYNHGGNNCSSMSQAQSMSSCNGNGCSSMSQAQSMSGCGGSMSQAQSMSSCSSSSYGY